MENAIDFTIILLFMKVRLKKENVMALELFTMVMEGKFIMDIGLKAYNMEEVSL